ncbi:hypothetical protein D3C76_1056710 [compost metagenome]
MADLAGAYLFVQRFQGFLQRGEVLFAVLVSQLAEEVGAALRPVQLVEVDPVGLQPLQAGVEGGDDVLAVVLQLAVADMADAVAGAGDLAGEDPVVAIAVLAEPVADDLFGARIGFRAGRYRVHLGGVDEVDAGCPGALDLREGFRLAVLFAPGHGSQAERTHLDVGLAERTVLHAKLLELIASRGCKFWRNRHNSAAFHRRGMPSLPIDTSSRYGRTLTRAPNRVCFRLSLPCQGNHCPVRFAVLFSGGP